MTHSIEAATLERARERPTPRAWRWGRRQALRWHATALAGYTILGLIFIDHGQSLTSEIAGQGSDPFSFVWFLAWWPWAISHHINPLFTNLVWQPEGVYLGWVTSVPLLAIIGWPLTLISPLLTFNFFVICGPILAAWMAYFLCLRISRQPRVAMIGGFLFGFSSYEMAQDTSVLNLSFTLCVPLLLLIVLARLDNSLSRIRLVVFGGLTLICQFLLCIEIFGMIIIFGGIAWLLSMAYQPLLRANLLRLAADVLWAAPFVLLVLSPFLVSMALHAGSIALPSAWAYYFVTDPLSFFIPSKNTLLGASLAQPVSTHFNGGIQEQDGYIGIPLLLIVALYAKEKFNTPAAKFLTLMLLVLMVLSLGPRLWLAGQVYRAGLPWSLFMHLPLLASALPARFALFVSLTSAVIAVLWMAASQTPADRMARLSLGLIACIFLLPKLHPWMQLPKSQFFQPGRVEAVLGQNSRVLILPFAINGPSPFWQEQAHFSFVQTGGYLGFPPKRMQQYKAVYQLFGGIQDKHFLSDVRDFCLGTHTQFIVVAPSTAAPLQSAIAQLDWPARKVDDVIIYTVPGQAPPHG